MYIILFIDYEVNEINVQQLRNFQHKVTGLYTFGNGQLVDLIF